MHLSLASRVGGGQWGAGGSSHSDPGPQRGPLGFLWCGLHTAAGQARYGTDGVMNYYVCMCPLLSSSRMEAQVHLVCVIPRASHRAPVHNYGRKEGERKGKK